MLHVMLLHVMLLHVMLYHLQALPIFLDRLVDPVTAVLLSVTVVLVFGEYVCCMSACQSSTCECYWHQTLR
jgi:hypothetical protein